MRTVRTVHPAAILATMVVVLRAAAPASAAASTAVPAAAATPNACVSCHSSLEHVAYLDHDFGDWRRSPHALAGVSCDSCHGGDPHAESAKAAHAGMKRSTDPASPVYFSRVPDTCGRCHVEELSAFRQSAHAKALSRTGGGPNCVTCHGAMANSVLKAKELDRTCSLCHRAPKAAAATLRSLDAATESVARLKEALDAARRAGRPGEREAAACERADQLLRRALIDWHRFRLEPVRRAAQDATRLAREAENELRVKSGVSK